MTDSSFPWDGSPWAETEWYRLMTSVLPSGVIGTPQSSSLAGPLAWSASGLAVTLAAGDAAVAGSAYRRVAPLAALNVTANSHASFARRDRLVLRRDLGTHTTTLVRLAGTPASSPSSPAITRTDTQWDLKLFSFLVPANNGTTITSIIDERTWVNEGIAANPGDQTIDGDLDVVGGATVGGTLVVSGTVTAADATSDTHLVDRGYVKNRTNSNVGTFSGSTNGSGTVTISHGLGETPDVVFIQGITTGGTDAGTFAVTAKTSTSFTVKVYSNEAVLASLPIAFYWRVETDF